MDIGPANSYAWESALDTANVVGTARSAPLPNEADERAVRLSINQVSDLGLGDGSNAYAINTQGTIVGGALIQGRYQGFIRSPSRAVTAVDPGMAGAVYTDLRAHRLLRRAIGNTRSFISEQVSCGGPTGRSRSSATPTPSSPTATPGTSPAAARPPPAPTRSPAKALTAAASTARSLAEATPTPSPTWAPSPASAAAPGYGVTDDGRVVGKAEPVEGSRVPRTPSSTTLASCTT